MYLSTILSELQEQRNKVRAFIPSVWSDFKVGKRKEVNYVQFISQQIETILDRKSTPTLSRAKNWTEDAVIYNMFARLCTAYDHDQDGMIGSNGEDITLNAQGLRETGTFLKSIALLHYLKHLGINTIHLLPVTEIGFKGRKGDLGSPYAIKNPFKIDPNLADPILKTTSLDDQFKAFVEAAHLLGMRVVQEFIFRTAAIDADWTAAHPDWFYWIKSGVKYGAPSFSSEELKSILKVPKGKGTFIPPAQKYRDLFVLPSGIQQQDVQVASAFADWPPDDLQPPWSDVTYFRMYNYSYQKDNNYNYIAYNTIRYYDPELAKPENVNAPLWDEITRIIPYYQENFGIDGAMIDMGHALPNELKMNIIHEARKKDKQFAFWDENFENTAETKKEGYDAVIGDAWYKITKRNGFKKLISSASDPRQLHYFGAAETHNSPRFAYKQSRKKRMAWLLYNLMPDSIPFLHNGFELNERVPVNTGLNFKKAEIDHFTTQRLPLFYKNSLNWDSRSNIIQFIQQVAELRQQYPWIFNGKNLQLFETDNDKILGFQILKADKSALILFNVNFKKAESFTVTNDVIGTYRDLVSDISVNLKGKKTMPAGSSLLLLRHELA